MNFLKFLISILAIVFVNHTIASPTDNTIKIDLENITFSQLIHVVYIDVLPSTQYVIDPKISGDNSVLSIRFNQSRANFHSFFNSYLNTLGYKIVSKSNVDFITILDEKSILSDVENPNLQQFIYYPKFRESSFLIDSLSPLFKGHFANRHQVSGNIQNSTGKPVDSSSALGQITQRNDIIIFSSTEFEIKKFQNLIAQIDKPLLDVLVTGVLYEVQSSEKNQNAVSLVSSILKNKLSVNLDNTLKSPNSLVFNSGDLNFIVEALNTDSRFKVLSNPSARVSSGSTAVFNVGSDVPTLGSISYQGQSGTPVQNIDYRSSGVIFEISPVVYDQSTSLKIRQEISNFITTTSGVNNSPTLTKRSLSTDLVLLGDDLVVVGGLRDSKKSNSSSGVSFLPSFLKSKDDESSFSEIVLFLKIERLSPQRVSSEEINAR